jgi:hypothetical protein
MSTTLNMSAIIMKFDKLGLHGTKSEQPSHGENLFSSQVWPEVFRERNKKDCDIKQHVRRSKRKYRVFRLVDGAIPEAVAFGTVASVPKPRDRKAWYPGHEGECQAPCYNQRKQYDRDCATSAFTKQP